MQIDATTKTGAKVDGVAKQITAQELRAAVHGTGAVVMATLRKPIAGFTGLGRDYKRHPIELVMVEAITPDFARAKVTADGSGSRWTDLHNLIKLTVDTL